MAINAVIGQATAEGHPFIIHKYHPEGMLNGEKMGRKREYIKRAYYS